MNLPKAELPINQYTVSLYVANYMLTTEAIQLPIQFLNETVLQDIVEGGYDYGKKLVEETDSDKILEQMGLQEVLNKEIKKDSLMQVLGDIPFTAMHEPIACIVKFKNDNTLLITGYNQTFYIIDCLNNIFETTKTPEFSVLDYQNKHNCKDVAEIHCLTLLSNKENKEEPSAPKKIKTKKSTK